MDRSLLFVSGLLAVGCAHHPAPTEQVAKSIAAVRGAQEAGANEVPEAALHVKLAQEQIALATSLMEDDDNARAEDKALRATQDAELAVVLARQHAAEKKLTSFETAAQNAGGEAPSTMAPSGVGR